MKTLRSAQILMAVVVGSFGFASMQGCSVDDTSTSEDDLTAAGKKLIGAHVATSTLPSGAHFLGLVLSSEKVTSGSNRFVADVDTKIVCVKAPCPSVVHVTGKFSAGTKTITLTADADQPNAALVAPLLGKYDYTRSGKKLKLKKGSFTQTLTDATSYCNAETAANDCALQALDTDCDGDASWSCSDQNKCEASCEDLSNFCDGFAGIQCSPGLFCKHPEGSCQGADIGGTCTPIPKCNPNFMEPVCACDGTTYANDCMATAGHAQISHKGPC